MLVHFLNLKNLNTHRTNPDYNWEGGGVAEGFWQKYVKLCFHHKTIEEDIYDVFPVLFSLVTAFNYL